MRMGMFILLAWIAMIAWFASALALERHREALGITASTTKADFQRCVRIAPGPLLPPRGPVFYPHNSELS